MNLSIIAAGAGSGKTYRLTHELVGLLKGDIRASGIIATTFTNKAAAELRERVRVKLLEDGMYDQADQIANAMIGTVHSLGVRLLRRFAFEMGVSPQVDIIAEEDHQLFFNQSLSAVLTEERVRQIEHLVGRFNLADRKYNWRADLRQLIETARTNGFDTQQLKASRDRSISEFLSLLDPVTSKKDRKAWDEDLVHHLQTTIDLLQEGTDTTKTTRSAVEKLQQLLWEWKRHHTWTWSHWAQVGKLKVAVKSRSVVEPLIEYAKSHEQHPAFRKEWTQYVTLFYDLAAEALFEYNQYKKDRGLIDYADMEVLVSQMLEREDIKRILKEEIDLLMVDEFQDTSPIQLDIFLKLSKLVKKAIWVGDPKQSIYGFRGADPKLMEAIIERTGGIRPENIQRKSWRSRAEVVQLTNALFTQAFDQIAPEQVALEPVRTIDREPIEAGTALLHWYIDFEGEGRIPGKAWMNRAIAELLFLRLREGIWIQPKNEKRWRKAYPGDVAVLCRTNAGAEAMAQALHEAGLQASLSRAGLLETAEAKLLIACLRYLLSETDSLAVAEILLLASNWPLEEIVSDRLKFLGQKDSGNHTGQWALGDWTIRQLEDLRAHSIDLSASEIVNLVTDELQLRSKIANIGKVEQRLANLEAFRKLALQYEDSCQRLHSAASLGGFLLWLYRLQQEKKDNQGVPVTKDAVQVLTYHKSKGLEWPIVICHDLDQSLKVNPWGITVGVKSESIDLDHVLDNRWIRYWINPYGKQEARTPISEKIAAHALFEELKQQQQEEEKRLLYVGITRARDYLILPEKAKQPTKWLNRVWNKGEEDLATLNHQSPESPFSWKGTFLPKESRHAFFGRDLGIREPSKEIAISLPPPAGRKKHPVLELTAIEVVPEIHYSILDIDSVSYGNSPIPQENRNDYALKKAMNAFLTAFQFSYTPTITQKMASQLLQNFKFDGDFAPLLEMIGRSWYQYLNQTYAPEKDLRKQRVQYWDGSRVYRGIVDLALQSGEEWLLIQNATEEPQKKAVEEITRQESARCWLLLNAWQAAFPDARIKTFIHFPLSCRLAEIQMKPLAFQASLDL